MLLILINWLIVLFISFTIGLVTRRMFIPPANNSEIAITVVWGLFIISLISTLCLFFIPAGIFLLLMFFLAAAVIQFFFREEIGKRLNLFRITIAGRREMVFGAVLLFCLLAFSSQSSKINDDGYYYVQTVLWFTREGFVNGIANLLLPLGLASSWHVLDALFSFNFIDGMRLNDLNGLLVLVFFIFCLENGFAEKQHLLLALLLAITLVVSVPFLSAPSPDLPVIIFTVMAFYLIARPFGSRTVVDVLVLAAFGGSVKLSAVALVLLAVVLIGYVVIKKTPVPEAVYLLLFLTGVSIISKNIFQTGYPFYPYTWSGIGELSWATPPELLQHCTAGIKYWGLGEKLYKGPISEWKNPGLADTVTLLWETKGYIGVINTFILLSFPLIIFTLCRDVYQRVRSNATSLPHIFLHCIFIASFFVWLILAPQYRFILPVYIFYFCWFVWRWLRPFIGTKFIDKVQLLPYVSITVLLFLSLVPVSFEVKTTSSHVGTLDGFSFGRLVKPHDSFSFPGIDTLRLAGQEYYHVSGNVYCWDSPLPCMSEGYYQMLREQGYTLVSHDVGGRVEFVLKKL